MRKHKSSFLSLLFTVLIASCSGSSSSTSDTTNAATVPVAPKTTLKGVAALGPVDGGTVTAYSMNPDGTPNLNNPLGTATTDANGNYVIDISQDKIVANPNIILQITGGTYTDESTGKQLPLSTTMSTVLPIPTDANFKTNGGDVKASITALTDIAAQSFFQKAAAGTLTPEQLQAAATNAAYAVGQAFGVSNIIGTFPGNPSKGATDQASAAYLLANATFSQQASAMSSAAMTPASMMQLIY